MSLVKLAQGRCGHIAERIVERYGGCAIRQPLQ
jgi:hypothetical protein